MRSKACWLTAAAGVLSLLSVSQAGEWTSAPAPPDGIAVPAVAVPTVHAPRGTKCRRLWQWLTYHGTRTPCCHHCRDAEGGCAGCCRGCAPFCTPHLYEYFLWEHPGCCHGDIEPAAAFVPAPGMQGSPPASAQQWGSDNAELPAPRPVPQDKGDNQGK
jgi:hypothetical protein